MFAQSNDELDSLQNKLEGATDPKERVDILLEIAAIQSRQDVVLSKKALRQVYDNAKEIDYVAAQVDALNMLGAMYAISGTPDTAIFRHIVGGVPTGLFC